MDFKKSWVYIIFKHIYLPAQWKGKMARSLCSWTYINKITQREEISTFPSTPPQSRRSNKKNTRKAFFKPQKQDNKSHHSVLKPRKFLRKCEAFATTISLTHQGLTTESWKGRSWRPEDALSAEHEQEPGKENWT